MKTFGIRPFKMNLLSGFVYLFLTIQMVVSKMNLSNGRLEYLLVYINDNVQERDGLIDIIKAYFKEASENLRIASNDLSEVYGGIQLGTVNIRIPQSWKMNASLSTWQACNHADVFVSTKRDNTNSNNPATMQILGCGKPGEFSRFTDEYFVSAGKPASSPTKYGKQVMREIVKLRYGVFNEEPIDNQLYSESPNGVVPFACSQDIKLSITGGNQKSCSKPNRACRYSIKSGGTQSHSVLFDTETTSSRYFCNSRSRTHNIYGKTYQNKLCNGQSISEVILKHEDFQSPRSPAQPQPVEFVIVKDQPRRIVMIIDVSGSMSNTIDKVKNAAKDFVKNVVEESAFVGLVTFDDNGKIVQVLTKMTDRDGLIRSIDSISAGGWTSVSDGLAKGVQVLGGNIFDTNKQVNGIFILLSDGGNNKDPTIGYDQAIDNVVKIGVTVNAVSFGDQADAKMAEIAKRSGGLYTFVPTTTPYTDLMQKFAARLPCENPMFKPVEVASGIKEIDTSVSVTTVLVTLDDFVGVNTTIRITVTVRSSVTYEIVDPDGNRQNVTTTIVEQTSTTLIFFIPGTAKKGNYSLKVTPTSVGRKKRATTSIAYSVISSPTGYGNRVISPTGYLSQKHFAKVDGSTKLTAAVDLSTSGVTASESVSVVLKMDKPNGLSTTFLLMDNGLNGDIIAGDYIYSAYVGPKDLNITGFYTPSAEVIINDTATGAMIKRVVSFDNLKVDAVGSLTPPDRITDLKIVSVDRKNRTASLLWSAVGKDVIEYEVKVISYLESLETLLDTSSPGTNLTKTITFDKTRDNIDKFNVTVRAKDRNGNFGEWSANVGYDNTMPGHSISLKSSLFLVMLVILLSLGNVCEVENCSF